MALAKYPEYHYPFSTSGELENKIDVFARSGGSVAVDLLLKIVNPRNAKYYEGGDARLNPTHFRKYYPHDENSWSKTIWAGEEAEKDNGYPHKGVRIGAHVECPYGQPLWRGGSPVWKEPQPYHCPYGWRRFSLQVENYADRCGKLALAYHGTSVSNLKMILDTYIRAGVCQEGGDGGDVYLTPSIEYASCPRYAVPLEWKNDRGEDRWVQVALQYRCKQPRKIQGETLGTTFSKACPGGWASRAWGCQEGAVNGQPYPPKHKVLDPHYKNDELEWLFSRSTGPLQDQVVPVGIMIRVTKEHPVTILKRRFDETPWTQ